MKSLLKLTLAPLVLTLAACSDSGKGPSALQNSLNASARANLSEMQGNWFGACQTVGEDGIRLEVKIVDKSIVKSAVEYSQSPDCSGDNYISTNVLANFTVSGEITSLVDGEAKNFDVTYSKGTITASPRALAALAELGTTLQDVAANEGINDINNVPLTDGLVERRVVYSIYRLEDNQLSFGGGLGSTDGSSAAQRHTKLETTLYIGQ